MLMTVTLIGQWEMSPPVRSGERAADLGALTGSEALSPFFPLASLFPSSSLQLRRSAPPLPHPPPR